MGTPMEPAIANIFMGWLKKTFISMSPVDILECEREGVIKV